LERTLPGGIRARWDRDHLGRPVKQSIYARAGKAVTRTYSWEVNDRLVQLIDSLYGATRYTHEPLSSLARAVHRDGRHVGRMPDAVGNLFRTNDRTDRKYGPAGQLLEAQGPEGVIRYEYDPEGNLIRKREPGNRLWSYEWNLAGMLAKVVRPDGREVTFGYD